MLSYFGPKEVSPLVSTLIYRRLHSPHILSKMADKFLLTIKYPILNKQLFYLIKVFANPPIHQESTIKYIIEAP